ncbi:MAG: 30S ribosomal protein S7 [Candidatus Pacebacteria bacterium]|jgi:small subunit ribosomal protein S7|nr:30S ribosomal protein S7 [Candidatus Paceibacterota bacterium]MBT3511537.1 30S ribosomal protein S7 [Candidatus Paceibacterota bacterium]MBT4004993.1 30S ribosomal protein S7 [Candidatus Paceibacterota bacterium]MBT4358769.1 30S ribosomal protein S7 [Candidatus Paceibacterota bacterium]MBT4680577.1 30S ribosomal protein S7 [Candidatus Paceibacterota bacterium]
MRTKRFPPRDIKPDLKYGSVKISQLINRVMQSGKKTVAQKQVYNAFEIVKEKTKRKPLEVYEEVLEKIKPQIEVRTRRVGGASYQVPMPVKARRANSLALRWLVNEANKRLNKEHHSFAEKLAAEMLDILNEQGGTINRRDTSHKMADANKAFAHFRW